MARLRHLLVFCLGVASGQQANLRGIVVNGISGEPLAKVQVHLLHAPPELAGLTSAYGAVTDAAGHFSIAPIEPGTYFVRPERAGFLPILPREPLRGPGPSIEIEAGQQVTDYRIEMAPRAIISGRVTNSAGDPVRGVVVRAESTSGDDMDLMWLTGVGWTDDRGSYRVGVPPGKYRVRAELPPSPVQEPEEIRSDETSPAALPVTWFPQAKDASAAGVVDVAAGKEVNGADIHMVRAVAINVSGTVSGLPPGVRAKVHFENMVIGFNSSSDAECAPDGSFKRSGLDPGIYNVYAETESPPLRSGLVQLTLSDVSVTGLSFALHPPADLSGKIDVTPNISAPDLRIRLTPMTRYPNWPDEAQPAADGSFKIETVWPARFEVKVRPEVPGVYLKSVSLNGDVAARNVIDLPNGVEGSVLKISLSMGAAHVSGSIEGKSARGWDHAGHVWLLADGAVPYLDEGPDMDRLYTGLDARGIRNRTPESDGTFQFDSLPPGRYRLFAVDYDSPMLFSREAVLQALERVEVIEVHEGDKLTKNIKPLGLESADGK